MRSKTHTGGVFFFGQTQRRALARDREQQDDLYKKVYAPQTLNLNQNPRALNWDRETGWLVLGGP